MSIATDLQLFKFNDWTFQWRPAQVEPGRLLILLHGWTGDENSMWILARQLSANYSILAPRGPYSAPEGGYSWRRIDPGKWGQPALNELAPMAESFLTFINAWSASMKIDARQLELIGFSQGAAMAYTLGLLHPDRVDGLAALSGFLPEGAEEILTGGLLSGKPVFVSHGRQDDMIPVARARRAVALLKESGARVTYCESDAGHKVSKECLKAMEIFFGEN